jgi:hypothetical protein
MSESPEQAIINPQNPAPNALPIAVDVRALLLPKPLRANFAELGFDLISLNLAIPTLLSGSL